MTWTSRIELDRAQCIYTLTSYCIYISIINILRKMDRLSLLSPSPSWSGVFILLLSLHSSDSVPLSHLLASHSSFPLIMALPCCSIHFLCALFRMLLPPRLSFDCMREFGCLIDYSSTLQDLQVMLIRMQYGNRGEGPAYFVCREYGRAPFVVDKRHWARTPPPTRMASHHLAFIL
jgi:hypothetical protein